MNKVNISPVSYISYISYISSHGFQVSYSNGKTKYDEISIQTLSATYDIANGTLECTIALDALGVVEGALIRLVRSSAPTISITRVDPSGQILYSTMCEIENITSCVVSANYSSTDFATVKMQCTVKYFDIVTP